MNPVTHDRGLGSAYERYCFYQRLDAWATAFGVESVLEGPLDGMAGIAGVHGVGLARRGIQVTSVVEDEARANIARGIYQAQGACADVRVGSPERLSDLPHADMVIAYHALPSAHDWRAYVHGLSKLAKKVLVVTVCNPDNWGVTMYRTVARLRGAGALRPPESWYTEHLAPVLWDVGRVKDHVYFDCPWWPDFPLSAGQSLSDRMKKLFTTKRRDLKFAALTEGVTLSNHFVYGAEKWPYFGGDGWVDELLPALLRHPCFDGAKAKLVSRVAHLHGFVVDVQPRTPQARRRLAVAAPANVS